MKNYYAGILVVLLLSAQIGDKAPHSTISAGKEPYTLYHPQLVKEFYKLNGEKLWWMTSDENGLAKRKALISCLDSAYALRLISDRFQYIRIQSTYDGRVYDSVQTRELDEACTDAAIALCKQLFEGYKSGPWFGYDQLTAANAPALDKKLLEQLLKVTTPQSLRNLLNILEPAHADYKALKDELRIQLQKNNRDTVMLITRSMNLYRWIHHFGFSQFIVINLPEARLRYYKNDSMVLAMKTVVGKPSTATPRFATVCDQAILYPYWYVPASILYNEYLPKIKRNPSWIDDHNMQVVDGKGRVLNHMKLNWSAYQRGNFPYILRQSTGCDNALGVLKFNIITPYGVYLHDTNNKTAFLSGYRFLSHGCIRIEQPLELGNRLLARQLDTAYLQSCFRDQQPHFVALKTPVPVFSVYMQAVADAKGKLRYSKDVYRLF